MRLILWKITCLLLALQTAASAQSPFCSLALLQSEMQAELSQYASAAQQLSSIFEEEKYLVGNVISFVLKKTEPLAAVARRLKESVEAYNNWVVCTMLVLAVCLICGLVARQIAKQRGYSLNKLAPLFAKTAKIVIAVLCLLVFLQACAGMSGGTKQKQSLNTILCRLFKEPRGMLRASQQSQDFAAFYKYADELDGQTLQNLQLYRSINNKLLSSKQAVRISKIVLQELQKEGNSSAFAADFAQSFRDLEQTIRPSLYGLLSQIYQIKLYSMNYAKIFRAIIKGVENYATRKGLDRLVSGYSSLVIGFYGLVMAASAALLFLVIHNRNQEGAVQSSLFPLVQYLLIMFLIICTLTCLLTSVLVPSFLWARQSKDYALSSRPQFYQQMRQLGKTSPDIVDLAALIAPTNMTFSQIFDRRFQTQSAEVNRIITPYLTFNSSYFYDQLKQALAHIQNTTIREKVALMIEQREVKQPFIAYFNDYRTIRTHVVDSFRQEQKINVGAFGKNLVQFFEVFTVLMLNRSFESHEISGKLIVCLSVLVCLLFASRQRREEGMNGHKKIETDEQSGLAIDMYVS